MNSEIPIISFWCIDRLIDTLALACAAEDDAGKALARRCLERWQQYFSTMGDSNDNLDKALLALISLTSSVLEDTPDFKLQGERHHLQAKFKAAYRQMPVDVRERIPEDYISDLLDPEQEAISHTTIRRIMSALYTWCKIGAYANYLPRMTACYWRYNPTDALGNQKRLTDTEDGLEKLQNDVDSCLAATQQTIDVIDMSNVTDVRRAVDTVKNRQYDNVFPTGWQALNKMLGEAGGYLRGEFVIFAACSHNYKSGIMLDHLRWFTQYSKFTVPTGTKPAVVFISLENEITDNMYSLLQAAWANIHREPPPRDLTDDDLNVLLNEYYQSHGVHCLLYRFDESFDFAAFVALQDSLRMKGYCVIASIIDYIMLMSVDGSNSDNMPAARQLLGHQLANYAKRNYQTIVTAMQLDRTADEIAASGVSKVVTKFSMRCLADCKGMYREADVFIFMHIQPNSMDIPLLQVAYSKHRYVKPPKKEDRYFAQPFSGRLGIIDDVNSTDPDYLRNPDDPEDVDKIISKLVQRDAEELKDLVAARSALDTRENPLEKILKQEKPNVW